MKQYMICLLALFSVALAATDLDSLLDPVVRQRVSPCGQFCKFRLCNFNGERFTIPKAAFVILGAPLTSQLPYICRPGDTVGEVLRAGEAQVRQGSRFVPISRWNPSGLSRNYPALFFRPVKVPFLPHSGIAPVRSSPNQWSFLHDKCWIMPVRRYERINLDSGRVLRRLNSNARSDCVAFRTTAPAIQVELVWDTPDDFDLEVREPDGDRLNFNNKRSEFGKLNGDNNVGFCDTKLLFGKENVLYFPNPNIEKGRYVVTVRHFTKCATRPTNWTLRIVVNGKVITTRRRFSAIGDNRVVGTAAFTI